MKQQRIKWPPRALLMMIVILSSSYHMKAQSITQQIIGAAGLSEGSQLRWTAGEIAVMTLGDEHLLQQGFHQGQKPFTTSYYAPLAINVDVYPNPASDVLYISHGNERAVDIKIIDIMGRVIYRADSSTRHTRLSLKGLESGTYTLQVYTDSQLVSSSKLIKLTN